MSRAKTSIRKKEKNSSKELDHEASPRQEEVVASPSFIAQGSFPEAPLVTIDRRSGTDRRKGEDRRKANVPVAVDRRKLQRRAKVNRRRQIDPTTCERDYTADEIEFMRALDQYKRTSGRMFPTCSEILEVLRNLGYEKRPVVQADSGGDLGGPSPPSASSTPSNS